MSSSFSEVRSVKGPRGERVKKTTFLVSALCVVMIAVSSAFSGYYDGDVFMPDLMAPALLILFAPSGTFSPAKGVFLLSAAVAAVTALVSVLRFMSAYWYIHVHMSHAVRYVPALLAFMMLGFICLNTRGRGRYTAIPASTVAVFFTLLLWNVYADQYSGHMSMPLFVPAALLFYVVMASRVMDFRKRKTGAAPVCGDPVVEAGRQAAMAGKSPSDILFGRIAELFDSRKPYLDDKITIGKVANMLYTNKVYVSRAINDHTGKNFCQYVNYHRIMYSVSAFRENPHLRISELAEMSGFHTIVSYNMAFRLVMNDSPGEWCKKIRQETGTAQ